MTARLAGDGNQVLQQAKQYVNPDCDHGGLVALDGEPDCGMCDDLHEHGLASPSSTGMPVTLSIPGCVF